MNSSTRWLVGMGAVLVLLVLGAVVAVLLTQGRQPPEYPEGTPEGVVQRYLKALADADTAGAYVYLAPDLQARCSREEWQRQARFSRTDLQESQTTLLQVRRPVEDEASVRVEFTRVEVSRPLPVPPSESSYEQQFFLQRESDGSWRFAEMPWPVFGCPVPEKPAQPVPARP